MSKTFYVIWFSAWLAFYAFLFYFDYNNNTPPPPKVYLGRHHVEGEK